MRFKHKQQSFSAKVINALSDEEIVNLVQEIGGIVFKEKDNEIWFNTICHHGNSHKLCYYKDSKMFYCYTNCGRMDIYTLLQSSTGDDFKTTLNRVAKKANIRTRHGFADNGSSMQEINMLDYYLELQEKYTHEFNETPLPIIKDFNLDYFEKDVFYKGWIDEGITIDSMIKYGIRWYELHKHIIIPHYDVKGNLIGIRRRSLLIEDEKRKYAPEEKVLLLDGNNNVFGHSLNYNLYGLHINKKAIQRLKKVIIVESEKSVLLSDSYYGDSSITVATCGFNVSNWHIDMLLSLGIEEVILGFDKDYDPVVCEQLDENSIEYRQYEAYYNRIYSIGEKFAPYCKVTVLWDNMGVLDLKDSPFDKGKSALKTLLAHRQELIVD